MKGMLPKKCRNEREETMKIFLLGVETTLGMGLPTNPKAIERLRRT